MHEPPNTTRELIAAIKDYPFLPPLTETSPMPFGKHLGTPMIDVPNEYLTWMYEQTLAYPRVDRSIHWRRVITYLSTLKSSQI